MKQLLLVFGLIVALLAVGCGGDRETGRVNSCPNGGGIYSNTNIGVGDDELD